MKKIKFLLIILISAVMIDVNAVDSNASIGSDLTEYSCSAFQDDNAYISGDTYFGGCRQVTCTDGEWKIRYYSTNSVSCENGNLNPYKKITKDGCSKYQNNSCDGTTVKYCTVITYFDCDRTSNGSKFTTTTKKPKPSSTTTTETTTVAPTETTTTAPVLNNNTYLSSLTLSSGSIYFNKDTRNYTIDVGSTISFINVTAKPEVETSKVTVTGNSNLIAGANKITITVTAEDGSVGTYVITVNKGTKGSNNAKLASLTIEGHEINFKSDVYYYSVKTGDSTLDIMAETEDQNAIYMIEGNNNLKDNSQVKVIVTAADGLTMQEYIITIDNPGSGPIIITIIFVLVLIVVVGAGGFYFYTKRKNAGEKEYEYE